MSTSTTPSLLSPFKWQDCLPQSLDWFSTVQVSQNTADQSSPFVIALVAKDKAAKSLNLLDETSAPHLKTHLETLVKNFSFDALQLPNVSPCKDPSGKEQLVLFVDLTDTTVSPLRKARAAGIQAAAYVKSLDLDAISILGSKDYSSVAVLEGLGLGLYDKNLFSESVLARKKTGYLNISKVYLGEGYDKKSVDKTIAYLKASAIARFCQDAPPNIIDATAFSEVAEHFSKDFSYDCEIKGRKFLEDQKMGSFLSVAQGSRRDPKLIIMKIKGESSDKCVALVGKGLCFDAGGISIKPSASMEEMKYDMSGGAAVLGAAIYTAQLKPKYDTYCVIGATENMVSDTATRPSDIVKAYNGKTIEILNTDAEGRLVLADCLAYVVDKYKPEFVINAATLTGACLHALGHVGGALMSNNDKLSTYIEEGSKDSGEPLWPLPLWPELEKEVKSEFADLQNIAKPNVRAGTIMGGMFLKQFIGQTAWAHLDIAGVANSNASVGFPAGKGGVAFGVRAMAEACLSYEGEKF